MNRHEREQTYGNPCKVGIRLTSWAIYMVSCNIKSLVEASEWNEREYTKASVLVTNFVILCNTQMQSCTI